MMSNDGAAPLTDSKAERFHSDAERSEVEESPRFGLD